MSSWTDKRPMSPHVSIWKWHVTMAASILNRMTGVGQLSRHLHRGVLAVRDGGRPRLLRTAGGRVGTIWGQLILFGFTLSICYHLLNGMRHLFWMLATASTRNSRA
jgi:succinate dehydrogenase / fumarate reductase cytochrome b subunit